MWERTLLPHLPIRTPNRRTQKYANREGITLPPGSNFHQQTEGKYIMTDKYTEKQVHRYKNAASEAERDDVLYRLGTHLEVIPYQACNGNVELTQEHRDTILDAAKGDKNHERG
jgi:hypothetical protein